jgi:hypothetical protein
MARLRSRLWFVAIAFVGLWVPAYAAEGENYLPGETQAVLTVDVKQMLASPLFKKDLGKIKDALKSVGEAQQTLDALGFDPLKDLDTLVIGGVGANEPEKVLIQVNGRFDPKKFAELAEKVAKDQGDILKLHKDGDRTIYEVTVQGQPRPFFAGVVDAKTIVLASQKHGVVDAFEIKGGKKKVALKDELTSLMNKSAGKRTISVVALGTALGGDVPFGDKVNHIDGGITIGDDIQTQFDIVTKDVDSAKGIAELLKQGLEQGKNILMFVAMTQKELAPLTELVDTLKISDKGSTVILKGEISKETLDKLKKDL